MIYTFSIPVSLTLIQLCHPPLAKSKRGVRKKKKKKHTPDKVRIFPYSRSNADAKSLEGQRKVGKEKPTAEERMKSLGRSCEGLRRRRRTTTRRSLLLHRRLLGLLGLLGLILLQLLLLLLLPNLHQGLLSLGLLLLLLRLLVLGAARALTRLLLRLLSLLLSLLRSLLGLLGGLVILGRRLGRCGLLV